MTKEQIEHAAVEYASSGKYGILNTTKTDFIAGAESRQAEIDSFDEKTDIVQGCLADLYLPEYNDETQRIRRIESCIREIEKL